jgi:putative SOS response-associated peptidase YedK
MSKFIEQSLESSKANCLFELKKLFVPFPSSKMIAYPVSRYVSNSRNEGPECMKRID